MNDEEMHLSKEAAEAEPRTTEPYDALEIDDESDVVELTDDDILFEIDERD
ncbi:MAG: hypothetical protein JO257_09245 [Deltaproteobacteria bacterium]|nr:hypothetical protein [Deltaproteobacteria bacterium]